MKTSMIVAVQITSCGVPTVELLKFHASYMSMRMQQYEVNSCASYSGAVRLLILTSTEKKTQHAAIIHLFS